VEEQVELLFQVLQLQDHKDLLQHFQQLQVQVVALEELIQIQELLEDQEVEVVVEVLIK
jgi:hypothetical protein